MKLRSKRHYQIPIIVIIILFFGLSNNVTFDVTSSEGVTGQLGDLNLKPSAQKNFTNNFPSQHTFSNLEQLDGSKLGSVNYRQSNTISSHPTLDKIELISYPLSYQPSNYAISLTQSDTININDTQQLIDLGLPGSGTEIDPYRIENRSFITNTSTSAIHLLDISDHVLIINNTFIHNSSSTQGGGILIDGSGNIDIINNEFITQGSSAILTNSINLISSAQINISNNIINKTRGISIENSNDFILENNTLFTTYFDSIVIDSSSNFTLSKNSIIFSGGAGIYVHGDNFSFDFQINNNQITGSHGAPFTIHHGSNFEIKGNLISSEINPIDLLGDLDSREQSEVRYSKDFLINGNNFFGAPVIHALAFAQYGMLKAEDSTNGSIISNTFNDYDWGRPNEPRKDIGTIRFLNVTDLIFANNSIDKSDVSGIYLAGIINATIEFNIIMNQELDGIFIANSSSITLNNNDILQTSVGIRISQVGNEFNGYIGKPTNIMIYDNFLSNNLFGLAISSAELVQIKGNSISNSEFGMDLFGSNQISVEENTITQSLRGISAASLDDSKIIDNTIYDNFQDGLYISQIFSPGELLVENNYIYDQSIRGARGINIFTKLGWKYSGITIRNNILEGNSVGIELEGSGVLISENLIFDLSIPDVQLSEMEIGLKINPGSKYNQIIFNEFKESIFSHIFIRSSNSTANIQLVSAENLIAWNNFYSFTVIPAFDEFGLNQFIYNYWSNLNSLDDSDSNGILDTELQIISSPSSEFSSYDSYPLSVPFQETSIFANPIIPEPIFLTPLDQMIFNNTRDEQLLIELKWVLFISSDQFMFGNETNFEFSIDYKSTSSQDWINIEDKMTENGYSWNITNLKDDFYEIRITGTNLITQRVTSAIITIDIGPVIAHASFFESPRNIALTITVAVGLTSAIVYGITTYRQNLQRKRDADVKGRARDYIDIARRIKEEEG